MRKMIVAVAVAALTVGVVNAPPAQAAPSVADTICSAIDANPSVATVTGLVTDLVEAGVSPYQAGLVIGDSVINHCVRNAPVLDSFIAFYSPVQGQTA